MNAEVLPTSAWIKIALVLLLMCSGVEVRAASESCEVVDVTDGATISVVCASADEKTIRLADVDGPAHQAIFRSRAERSLSELLLHKQVRIEVVAVDEDGASVAEVYLGGTHVNARVVSDGMARCRQAARSNWCEREEADARSGLRGIWSAPWVTTGSVGSGASMNGKQSI